MAETDRTTGLAGYSGVKVPVRVASTAALTLSGEQTIDGVACVTGDRVLVKNQASSVDNGIWTVFTGTWNRSPDCDGSYDLRSGSLVPVYSGTTNGGSVWRLTTSGQSINIGTDSLTFSQALFSSLTGVTFIQAGTGAVSRDAQTKMREVFSVKDFGATGDGITNDTTAVTNAINAAAAAGGGTVYFPPGSYLCTAMTFSTKDYVRLLGAGRYASYIKLSAAGTMMTFSNCQWFTASQLSFQLNGTPQSIAATYGVQLDTGSGNCHIDDCSFVGFAQDGLRLVGTVGTPLSGHKITNCYFLGNGVNQFYSYYSNDYHYENNQFGDLAAITKATFGMLLDHSSAGTYTGNYHWHNGIGFKADTCNYSTIALNRFEQSNTNNVYITGGSNIIFTENKAHTASQTASGASDNVYITGVARLTVTDNQLFTYDATYSRWGINIDAGCTEVTLGKNKVSTASFDSTNFGPIRVDGGVLAVGFKCDRILNGATSGTVAAATTTYLGCNAAQATEAGTMWEAEDRYAVVGAHVAVTGAPGAGETNTYTLRKSGADTAMTGTITGAASFIQKLPVVAPQVLIPYEGQVTVKVVTTNNGGYVAAYHRYVVMLAEY